MTDQKAENENESQIKELQEEILLIMEENFTKEKPKMHLSEIFESLIDKDLKLDIPIIEIFGTAIWNLNRTAKILWKIPKYDKNINFVSPQVALVNKSGLYH